MASGVPLDTGDFTHTKPDGMVRPGLKVVDKVKADDHGQRLSTGKGWLVGATAVDGKALGPR